MVEDEYEYFVNICLVACKIFFEADFEENNIIVQLPQTFLI